MLPESIQKKLAEGNARAASRGFTLDYQNEREQEENTICHKELAPATLQNYENTALNWILWRLSRNEAANANFGKEEPDPTPQLLKSFAEYFIATRKDLPSQKTACQNFINFTSRWERETSRSLPNQDGAIKTTNIYKEYLILGLNFVFWVIVYGVADGAFKGLNTVADVLVVRPLEGRESYMIKWVECKKDLPFFRMVTPEGPSPNRSILKSLDIQALIHDLEPDYKYRNIEQSMAHYQDLNTPQKLDTAAIAWNSAYNIYVAGNEFTERDRTLLFGIFEKYLPERI
ncbi:uncharacterized protein N7483_011576 [Penicillium malachiteum]|uniref:uncharacterized protein n=1 Tax=Penicillium malachiteum TaxID=1324776 RepID=UPI00254932EA|nr:uncharacterized protein N7483_011576 [Penicillium malachiteum]KAJ5714395.1 hypothetical protein N7483_011576 [Penicillium malachiteum]